MAIDQGNTTTTQNIVDRTWRIEFYVNEDDTVHLRFYRELRAKDTTTGKVIRDRATIPILERPSSAIAAKSYTAGGLTATGQQILQLCNKMSDTERQFDIDNPVTP